MRKEDVLQFIEMYEEQDKEGILRWMSDEVIVNDPHFPIPTMEGIAEVTKGLEWSFQAIKKTRLIVQELSIYRNTAFIELDTRHNLKIGLSYHYLQLLKIEYVNRKIVKISTYVTYAPGGLRGIVRRGVAVAWQASSLLNKLRASNFLPRSPFKRITT